MGHYFHSYIIYDNSLKGGENKDLFDYNESHKTYILPADFSEFVSEYPIE